MTCKIFSALPETTPAAMAAWMPLRPPVLGTTTLLTFLMMLPDTSATIRSGAAPRMARIRAAA